ncbi:uncharacterized protein L969DRAFT_94381 [Mixia osmundae IAM 14324]|uniref:RING-type domain-containing protein n=1 Tax=Mixia osmundae (strain CBS 9802 / IAM 14324 / JCM 22182 / KY 12970) TaxID=764103 RepID=G7E3B1_MIXOS|nr:uncharacterized protein L969DRAFT_94381 [Mixia osmundae IAM 14324]KEI39308.1 hypothetical protein L969DRAFT_94381 [Mixia osmundae IAM 14324]GAA97321.1 hypothetical protein E5Q_03999 [Mixia osmundae IAM 14324]
MSRRGPCLLDPSIGLASFDGQPDWFARLPRAAAVLAAGSVARTRADRLAHNTLECRRRQATARFDWRRPVAPISSADVASARWLFPRLSAASHPSYGAQEVHMDLNELRCNHLKCRKILSLEGKGVSTSCSHVFCVACANTLFTPERLCPACETHLPHDDDMLYFSLNPSTEFRNTVLAGLSPSIIVDIVSRALNFWTYQQGQEKIFQEMLLKHSQEHATILEQDNLNITQRANQELDHAQRELDMTRQQQRDLQTTLRGSQRQQHSLQSKYDRMRASIGPRANPDLLATSSGTSPAAAQNEQEIRTPDAYPFKYSHAMTRQRQSYLHSYVSTSVIFE